MGLDVENPFSASAFAKYSLATNLSWMVRLYEAEVEARRDAAIRDLTPDRELQSAIRTSLQRLDAAFESLFSSSQDLVRKRPPADADVSRVLDVLKDLEEETAAILYGDPMPEGPPPAYEETVEAYYFDDLLGIRYQCQLAREMIAELPAAARRAQELVRIAADARPGPLGKSYLRRVASCFTWGYETETLVLCGSVLEQVLQDEIEDSDVRNAFAWKPDVFPYPLREELKKGYPPTLRHRIFAAQALGIITPEQVDLAEEIRLRRNKAVHDARISRSEEASDVDVAGTVRALTEVVGRLCGKK